MSKYDLTILGNAPIDALFSVDDACLSAFSLKKGDWQRLPTETYAALMQHLTDKGITPTYQPGGSGANTAWHLGRIGRNIYFAGLVGDDAPGLLFHQSMMDAGVDMPAPVTGLRSFVLGCLITPDGERTFVSDGHCPEFEIADVPASAISDSRYVLLEGYLLGAEFPALKYAAELAQTAGAKLILTLAAPSFVKNHFVQLSELLVQKHGALFFANDEELNALRNQIHTLKDPALQTKVLQSLYLTDHVVTHGKRGAEYYRNGHSSGLIKPLKAVPLVVDATGAGDSFAAGFLHVWLADDTNTHDAILTGHTLAGKVIAHKGARPNVWLDD